MGTMLQCSFTGLGGDFCFKIISGVISYKSSVRSSKIEREAENYIANALTLLAGK